MPLFGNTGLVVDIGTEKFWSSAGLVKILVSRDTMLPMARKGTYICRVGSRCCVAIFRLEDDGQLRRIVLLAACRMKPPANGYASWYVLTSHSWNAAGSHRQSRRSRPKRSLKRTNTNSDDCWRPACRAVVGIEIINPVPSWAIRLGVACKTSEEGLGNGPQT